MPDKKMILTQNLVFNVPFVLIMVAVTNLVNGQGFGPETIGMILIAFVVVEILGFVVPVQKIAGFFGEKVFHGKNPMAFPQFFLVGAVLTLIFTTLMTLIMTFIGMKMGGAPMNMYWSSVGKVFPWLLLAAYCSVLIFLPLSMKVSGMDKLGAPPQK